MLTWDIAMLRTGLVKLDVLDSWAMDHGAGKRLAKAIGDGGVMNKMLLACGLAVSLSGCGDECSSYSKYSCSQIQQATYNVYFYFPDGQEKYLGEVSGLQQCSAAAADYANQTGAPKNWVCCMKTSNSSCEEKHR